MSRISLPYNGESTPEGAQLCLSEKQTSLLDSLAKVCLDFQTDNEDTNKLKCDSKFSKKYSPSLLKRNNAIDKDMLDYYPEICRNISMIKFRQSLPCFSKRDNILHCVRNNQVVVISGETGCGKTTQVPQYILEEASSSGQASSVRIVCTQPRRVAAITVAERVATETGTKVGNIVGYQVRLDSVPPRHVASILYCTTGVLVQRLQSDKHLDQFTHVIIDEIHERDVLADILLVIIKQILPQRPDLKVVLMSATLNASKFSNYMNNCETLHVPGFMFPVDVYYLEDVFEMTNHQLDKRENDHNNNNEPLAISRDQVDGLVAEKNLSKRTAYNLLHPLSEEMNLDLMADIIIYIHERKPPGAILVFVPGWDEISSLTNIVAGLESAVILPLHGSMSGSDQRKIFQPSQTGFRKIIIATNIAESSVTINDIVYVVDCGKAKMKKYDVENNYDTLQIDWISQANAKQRMGRAGRLRNGEVYKIYTKAKEETFTDFMIPEITRCRLENVILKLKVLGFDSVDGFFNQLMDIPDEQSIAKACQTLIDIGALSKDGKELTGLGTTLGQIPSDPRLGKMMILGAAFSCLDPILSVVTYLEYKSPFVTSSKMTELTGSVDRMSSGTMSDHLTVANVMAAWDGLNSKGGQAKVYGVQDFTKHNFLSPGILFTLDKMKKQLAAELFKIGLIKSPNMKDPASNSTSGCEAVVRSVISLGLLPNILNLHQQDDTIKVTSVNNQELAFHPRSCNRNVVKYLRSLSVFSKTVPRLYCYFEKMSCNSIYISDSTAIGPLPLMILSPNLEINNHPDPSADTSIDNPTKKKLGVLFAENNAVIHEIVMKSGSSASRLLLCDEETMKKVRIIRSVVGRLIEEKCAIGSPYGENARLNSVFNTLLGVLYQDRIE